MILPLYFVSLALTLSMSVTSICTATSRPCLHAAMRACLTGWRPLAPSLRQVANHVEKCMIKCTEDWRPPKILCSGSNPRIWHNYLHGHTSNFGSSLFLDRDVTAILLGHDKWEKMLRHSSWDTPTPHMRDLIVFMPGKLGLGTHPQFQERMMTSLFFHGGGGRACDWQKFETNSGVY